MRPHSEDDLNAAERAAYAELPREENPGRAVEDRIVRALTERGLLNRARASRGAWWWVGVAAAAVVAFGAGLAAGEYRAEQRVERQLAAARDESARDAAMRVQQTGSAYVEAVARLGRLSAAGRNAEQTMQGHEIALSTLQAAVTELHQVSPNDPFTTRLLEAMSSGATTNARSTQPGLRRISY
jgi:hypothetical protein